jgi:hypothetical protein
MDLFGTSATGDYSIAMYFKASRDSAVGIETGWTTERLGFESR